MAAKKKAAKKAGAGALAAGQAARSNEYIQRLAQDPELRDNLKTAAQSARKAYSRISGKGASKALDDKKVQKELKEAAESLKVASERLRNGKPKKKRGFGKLVAVALIGGIAALAVSEDLRKKALDALFGAEEEFEYSSGTSTNGSSATSSEAVNAS